MEFKRFERGIVGGAMSTSVICAGCHRRYEVDSRFAGKTVKCAHCGQAMPIPVAEPAGLPPSAHGEYGLGAPHEPAQSSFQASPRRQSDERVNHQSFEPVRKKRRKRSRSKKERATGFLMRPGTMIILAAVCAVVALVGVFVPAVRVPIGVALALPGALLCLYGYATGAYIAFTEDDLHGWLFLLFPFYAAYYLVSRWDDMSSRLIMVVVGLVLLGIGGKILEAEVARAIARSEKSAVDR
jgi:hypothetical protein